MDIEHKSMATRRALPKASSRKNILLRQRNLCIYCGIQFGEWIIHKNKPYYIKPNWDHVVPYSYCFNNSDKNFVASCFVCNGIKSDKIFDTFQQTVLYVQTERIKQDLPVFKLYGRNGQKAIMAEVLLHQLPEPVFLENPPNNEEDMTMSQIQVRLDQIRLQRQCLEVLFKSKPHKR